MDETEFRSRQDLDSRQLRPGDSVYGFCNVCGALTYVRFYGNPGGLGDPEDHARWHQGMTRHLRGLEARVKALEPPF